MNVLLSGASGLVGRAVRAALESAGHSVRPLARGGAQGEPNAVAWDPLTGRVPEEQVNGADWLIHLAGENIASGRWTAAKKARIYDSRAVATRLLCDRLAAVPRPPRVIIAASAIGYYGDRGDERLDELSPPGLGFLPEVCQAWEDAVRPAAAAGVRTVNLRIGVVLSAAGGALARMLPLFRAGLGGRLGDGRQFMSWIALDDLVRVIEFAAANETLSGPINAVAPTPVRNRAFAQTLAAVLHRPAFLPTPGFVLRTVLGEMADALLLASAQVFPERLLAAGFQFQHPQLADALKHLLQ